MNNQPESWSEQVEQGTPSKEELAAGDEVEALAAKGVNVDQDFASLIERQTRKAESAPTSSASPVGVDVTPPAQVSSGPVKDAKNSSKKKGPASYGGVVLMPPVGPVSSSLPPGLVVARVSPRQSAGMETIPERTGEPSEPTRPTVRLPTGSSSTSSNQNKSPAISEGVKVEKEVTEGNKEPTASQADVSQASSAVKELDKGKESALKGDRGSTCSEWHENFNAIDHVDSTVPDGDDIPLDTAVRSERMQGVQEDLKLILETINGMKTEITKYTSTVESLKAETERIKISNNQFSTETLNRIRALERKLEHDPTVVTRASALSPGTPDSGEEPALPAKETVKRKSLKERLADVKAKEGSKTT